MERFLLKKITYVVPFEHLQVYLAGPWKIYFNKSNEKQMTEKYGYLLY